MTQPMRIALLGNPNTGKSTLFNRLCGLRTKTANFPGSTVEHHIGKCTLASGTEVELIDLPGIYSLMLELPESRLCMDCLDGRVGDRRPDAALVVLDANNLQRNLQFAAGALRRGLPTVIAINMVDLARKRGLVIDADAARRELGVPVIAISARTGEGIRKLQESLAEAATHGAPPAPSHALPKADPGSPECIRWASAVFSRIAAHPTESDPDRLTLHDRLDAAFTHPVIGIALFAILMAGVFASIYWLAQFPMDGVDFAFGQVAAAVEGVVPEGVLQDLLVKGVIGGVAATVIFVPQIVLLFFLLALLEDSGYLARAAFALDRVMRRFGLPGQAFMPLLSAHACALPAIMSTRLIPDARDRITTILVAPFMSCSARVPVYVLLIGLLFADRPLAAGIAFTSCYVLGALAAIATAKVLRSTVLRGATAPMMLELPDYRWPSVATAVSVSVQRGLLFLRNAGSVILAIAVVMWWLSAYPRVSEDPAAVALAQQAQAVELSSPEQAEQLRQHSQRVQERAQQAGSFAGSIGALVSPAFAPIGLDRQLTVAVLTSFLAREVFTTTVFVLAGAGSEAQSQDESTLAAVRGATRDDGTPLFTPPTAAALLVFFVLAMQCLPTLVIVARETGSWKWPLYQLMYMSALAYGGGVIAYRLLS